ncbi:MAG: response regulator [SAR324 cluster bacterium]|nr:response regulator [SAR324 cluster bacterium]MBF0350132.1 response regulator [SAR324 cluster bacterium]
MSKKALVMDDSPIIRKMLTHGLTRSFGFEVIEAENGQDGLTKTSQHEFDLIFSDINMPVMTGVEFLEKFRSTNTTTPVFMLTSEKEDVYKQKCLDLGATDFFKKPFKPNTIEAALKQLLEG